MKDLFRWNKKPSVSWRELDQCGSEGIQVNFAGSHFILHKDPILLGWNFEEELVVSSLHFEVKIQELVHVDAFAHPSELSTSTSALSRDFKKLFEVKRKLRARRFQFRHS